MIEKYNSLHSQLAHLSHTILLVSLIAGIVIGFIIASLAKQDPAPCKIEYISRDEIMLLEKARLARTKEKELFFGKSREAIKLIENLAKSRKSQGNHVILTKNSYVRGKGVNSISEEIHSEIVQRLKKSLNSGEENRAKEKETGEEKDEEKGENESESDSDQLSSATIKLLKQLEKNKKWQD